MAYQLTEVPPLSERARTLFAQLQNENPTLALENIAMLINYNADSAELFQHNETLALSASIERDNLARRSVSFSYIREREKGTKKKETGLRERYLTLVYRLDYFLEGLLAISDILATREVSASISEVLGNPEMSSVEAREMLINNLSAVIEHFFIGSNQQQEKLIRILSTLGPLGSAEFLLDANYFINCSELLYHYPECQNFSLEDMISSLEINREDLATYIDNPSKAHMLFQVAFFLEQNEVPTHHIKTILTSFTQQIPKLEAMGYFKAPLHVQQAIIKHLPQILALDIEPPAKREAQTIKNIANIQSLYSAEGITNAPSMAQSVLIENALMHHDFSPALLHDLMTSEPYGLHQLCTDDIASIQSGILGLSNKYTGYRPTHLNKDTARFLLALLVKHKEQLPTILSERHSVEFFAHLIAVGEYSEAELHRVISEQSIAKALIWSALDDSVSHLKVRLCSSSLKTHKGITKLQQLANAHIQEDRSLSDLTPRELRTIKKMFAHKAYSSTAETRDLEVQRLY